MFSFTGKMMSIYQIPCPGKSSNNTSIYKWDGLILYLHYSLVISLSFGCQYSLGVFVISFFPGVLLFPVIFFPFHILFRILLTSSRVTIEYSNLFDRNLKKNTKNVNFNLYKYPDFIPVQSNLLYGCRN